MDYDYKHEIQIDPNNLDQECLEHASRYLKYAEATAEAQTDMDKAKRKLEVTISEREMYIRTHLSDILEQMEKDDPKVKAKEIKVSESLIKSLLDTDEAVKKAYAIYFERQKEYRIMSKAEVAFDHRKRSLTNLVQMAGFGYFSFPIARPLAREKSNIKQQDETARDVSDVLRRGKK